MQDVLDVARLDLNDAKDASGSDVNCRNKDADMLNFANDGISRGLVLRPDLNWGNYASGYVEKTLTDPFPLPLEYRWAISNYVVARCESSDDAFVIQGRADKEIELYFRDLGVS